MGKYRLKSGYGKFQNIQAGTVSVTVDTNGDGTAPVTFKRKFKNNPVVIPKVQFEADTAVVNPTDITLTGFTAHVDNSATTGQAVTIGYFAIDDPKTGFA